MQPILNHITKSVQNAAALNHLVLQQKKWYAIYTRPRYEKRVYEKLQNGGIDCYLPLQITIKQWSDRKKKVSEPLFSCYLFVNITFKDYYRVLNTVGVMRYITFEGKAVSIPEKQIQLIKNLLAMDYEISETMDFYPAGTKVTIKAGPLIGITGELVEYSGKKRVIIRIDEICKSIQVNIPIQCLAIAV